MDRGLYLGRFAVCVLSSRCVPICARGTPQGCSSHELNITHPSSLTVADSSYSKSLNFYRHIHGTFNVTDRQDDSNRSPTISPDRESMIKAKAMKYVSALSFRRRKTGSGRLSPGLDWEEEKIGGVPTEGLAPASAIPAGQPLPPVSAEIHLPVEAPLPAEAEAETAGLGNGGGDGGGGGIGGGGDGGGGDGGSRDGGGGDGGGDGGGGDGGGAGGDGGDGGGYGGGGDGGGGDGGGSMQPSLTAATLAPVDLQSWQVKGLATDRTGEYVRGSEKDLLKLFFIFLLDVNAILLSIFLALLLCVARPYLSAEPTTSEVLMPPCTWRWDAFRLPLHLHRSCMPM